MDWYVGTEWKLERKGLRKIVLALDFSKVEKPHQVSKVVINVVSVENLKERDTQWLNVNTLKNDQIMEMGTSLTPIDYYMEILVQQMMLGETAECNIKSKIPEETVKVILTLKEIKETKGIQELNVLDMYNLALRYKENGVKMFKRFPKFSHKYFSIAAKCLISYKNFEHFTKQQDGVSGKDMQDLFIQIQTNLAACLLIARRYDDVLYQTNFVDQINSPSEKSIYRRAIAYYHKNEYELAQKTIEKVTDYKDKKEFVNLHKQIFDKRKNSNEQYKGMVQKMFG